MPCTGCAWLIKYKYSEPHVDRMTEVNICREHPCAHNSKRRAASPAAAADAEKKPRPDACGNFRISANVPQEVDGQMRSPPANNLQNDDEGYVDPGVLFAGLRNFSTGKRHEKTPVTVQDVRAAGRAALISATPSLAGSAASLPQCSDFVGFPWMTGEPAGVLGDGLIAQLALAEELLSVPAKRNSRSLYKSSDYITMNLLNLAITPSKAGLAALTDFRTKLRAADAQVQAAVASARSVLFGGVPEGSTYYVVSPYQKDLVSHSTNQPAGEFIDFPLNCVQMPNIIALSTTQIEND